MIRQIDWTPFIHDISWSKSTGEGEFARFAILKTTSGFTVVDTKDNSNERTTTLAAARAWAGIRVGEKVVRRK